MPIVLNHQTKAQFMLRLKKRWQDSTKEQRAKIAEWIYRKYQAGEITAANIKTAFEFTDAQFSAFVAKITELRDSYNRIQQEV